MSFQGSVRPEYCPPEPLQATYCYADANKSVAKQIGAPMDAPVAAAANNQLIAQAQDALASQQNVECHQAYTKKVANEEHGTATAARLVYIGGETTIGQLVAGTAHFKPSAEQLQRVFQVHGRSEENRHKRVGNISDVSITRVSFLETGNNSGTEVTLSSPLLRGKPHSLMSNMPGVPARPLLIVAPGYTSYHGHPRVVYESVRQELAAYARILGSFDMDQVAKGYTHLPSAQGEGHYLVPVSDSINWFMEQNAAEWGAHPDNYPTLKDSGHKVYPAELIDCIRHKILLPMQKKMHAGKHDMQQLQLDGSTCGSCPTAVQMLGKDTTVKIWVLALVEYAFLEPHTLKA